MQWSFQVILSQNARFSTKITNFSPHKNPSGLVGFHSRVRVFSGFSSKVGFGFRSGKNSRGRVFVGFGLDPLHHYYIPQYIYSILQIYQWECSAEAVTPELVRQFFKIFPTGKTICNFYGSTEMSDVTYATFGSLEDFESKLDSNRQVDSTPSVFMYYIFV